MGKGDKKTKRGKITLGTFGVRRLRKKRSKAATIVTKAKDKTVEIVETVVVEETASITVETVAEPKVVAEEIPVKTAKPAKEKKETKSEKVEKPAKAAKTVKPEKAEKPAKEPKAKKEKKAE